MALYEIIPTNMRGSGTFFKGRAGEALGRCQLVYKAANGAWYLADADLAATMPTLGLTMERVVAGQIVRVLKEGYIGRSTWAWVTGGEMYADGVVPGELVQVPPAAPSLTQVVGMATRQDMIYFDPTMDAAGATLTGYIGDYTYKVIRVGANYTVYDTQGAIVQGPGLDADVAINWALNAGGVGCVVYLTESTIYAIDDPIAFTANSQVIRGGGRSSFIDGDGLATTEHGIVLSAFTDCQIRNLSIQTEDGGGKTCHCIFIEDGADRFLVENVTIVDSDSDGIHIEGTTITGWDIRNCKILDADDYGIYGDMDAVNYLLYGTIEENTVTGCGFNGMGISDFVDGVINDNIVYDCDLRGILLNLSANITVSGNVCHSNVRHGIALTSTDNCVVEDNVCPDNDSGDTGTYDGINLDALSTDNIVSGNELTFNDRYGIGVFGARNKVTNNKCSINGRHGIYITEADCQVNDNDCYDNGQDAAGTYHEICLSDDADRCMVNDNHLSSPGDSSEDCIHLEDGAIDCTIEGNYCFNGMGSGIALTANNDDCSIIGNRCTDNNGYGIEITAATCNDTRVKENHLEGNVTGQFFDGGTDTQTPWFFAPVSDPNHVLGRHPVVDMPENTDTNVYAQIMLPLEFQELVTCNAIVVPAASGNLVWTVNTDFGKLCDGETYNTHSDVSGGTAAITIDELECLSLEFALTGISAGDLIGVDFMRDGDDVADDIEDSVYYLGIRVRYV